MRGLQTEKTFGGCIKITSTRILVTDGQNKNALAVLRSIGRKYWIESSINNYSKKTYCMLSKYSKETYTIPVSSHRIDNYARGLLSLVMKNQYDVLLPVGLYSNLVVSKYKKSFKRFTNVLISNWESMKIAYNKDQTNEFAKKISIPIPMTQVISDVELLNDLESFPLVLKISDFPGNSVRYCNNLVDAKKKFIELKGKSSGKVIAQEYIKGFGCGFYGVCYEGSLIASFMHRRIKEFPITGGPSAVAESYFDKKLFYYGKRFVEALKWTGPIMIEFKYDIADKDFKLIEINPKLWGSLDLTIAAGINIPEIIVSLALGKEIKRITKYKYVKYRWVFPDEVRVLFSDFSFKNLKDFLRLTPGSKVNISLNDPGPTFLQFYMTLKEVIKFLFLKPNYFPHGKAR